MQNPKQSELFSITFMTFGLQIYKIHK